MAEDLVKLVGDALATTLAEDPHIVTQDELIDILNVQHTVENNSSDADATDNEGVLITEDEAEEEDDEPTVSWFSVSRFLASCGINLILPFINGMMLGFGEILAHELGFKYGWIGAKVYPQQRMVRAQQQRLKSQYL